MPLLIGVVVIIVVVLLVSWVQDELLRRRRRRMQAQAEQLGYRPSEAGEARLRAQAGEFLLFAQGRDEISHLVEQEQVRATGPVTVTLFDYTFKVPLGRYVQNWRQTAVKLSSAQLALPDFSVMPSFAFNQMVGRLRDPTAREHLLGTAGLTFEGHRAYGRELHVWADTRAPVQALMTDALLAFHEAHPDLCVEGVRDLLLFYDLERTIQAEELEDFLNTIFEGYDLYVAACRKLKEESL